MIELRSSAPALRCSILVIAVLACSLVASAQFDTGTIAGSVADSSGAVMPHATVTITNVGTGIRKSLQTDNSGGFVASAMPFGNYVVSASASNFAEAKSDPIVLNV